VLSYFARARLLRHWRAWTCALQHSLSQLHEQRGGNLSVYEQGNESVAAAQRQDREEEEMEEEAELVRDPRAEHRDTQAAQQQAQVIVHANMCIGVDEMFMSHSSLHTSSRPLREPKSSRIGICEQYVSQYVPSAPAHPVRSDSSLIFARARDSGHVVIARQETTMTPNGSIKQVITAQNENRHKI